MRHNPVRTSVFLVLSLIVAGSLQAADDESTHVRKGKWDFVGFTGIQTSNTLNTQIDSVDVRLEIEDDFLLGLRAEGHMTDHVAFGLSFTFADPDFETTSKFGGSTSVSKGDLVLNFIDADITWRWLKRRSTPYAVFGIGAFNLGDKLIRGEDGGPDVLIAEQHFQYHAALGWEWQLREHLVLNVSARASVTELDGAGQDLVFTSGVVGVGYRSGPPDPRKRWPF